MKIDWLIVGLGNPGDEYEYTRHNIGWMVCRELARRHNGAWSRGSGEFMQAAIRVYGTSLLVMLPTTYMNASGKAVAAFSKAHLVASDRIMAVVDEYNFPVGKVHVRIGGSAGGHNGIDSLIEELRAERFYRLRCGIAKNFGPGELVRYVLSPFDTDETAQRDAMIARAADAIEYICKAGMSRAASIINSDADIPGGAST